MSQTNRTSTRRAKGIRLSVTERHYERGLHLYVRGKLDQALEDLDAAIERDPRNAELYAARGLMLVQTEWTEDAETDLDHALRLDPTQWIAHYARGLLAFQAKQYQEAVDHFSRAQVIENNRGEIYYHRAVAFYELDDLRQAALDMEAAKALFVDQKKRQSQTNKWLKIIADSQPDTNL